ncbi:MAG: murein biosynthesis integral membrane protein MurJ [Patescibacteria group bacterium]
MTKSIGRGAFIISVFAVLSRVVGLVRERLLASTYGAGPVTDAYFAAFKIPDFIFTILVLGALSAAFIPVFIKVREEEGEARAWRVVGSVLTILTAILTLLALIAALAAPLLMRVFVPGFSVEYMMLTVRLTRIMLISVIFFGASHVCSGVLNAAHRYVAFSFAPLFYNCGIIIGITLFTRFWGPLGLAWGVVLGAVLHFLVQVPAVKALARGQLRLRFTYDHAVKRILALMGPRMLGLAASQVNTVVVIALASVMAVGSVAVYNFAFNLISFPSGVIGVSFAVAAFPFFATHAARREMREFGTRFRVSISHILAALVPLSVFSILLRAQIVRVILGTGAFDWTDTVLTANTMGLLAISLCADGIIPLLARSFYAFQDTKTPVKIGISAVGLNVLLALSLMGFGVEGIALALALTQIVQGILLAIMLNKKIPGLFDNTFAEGLVKIVAAAAGGAVVLQLLKNPLASLVNMETGVGVLLQGLGAGWGGFMSYYLLARYFKCPGVPSFGEIKSFILRRT